MNPQAQQIKEFVLPILRRYEVTKAALFGSIITGTAGSQSDVDILVQIDRDISLLDFIGLKLELEDALHRKVDLVEYDTIKPLIKDAILEQQVQIL